MADCCAPSVEFALIAERADLDVLSPTFRPNNTERFTIALEAASYEAAFGRALLESGSGDPALKSLQGNRSVAARVHLNAEEFNIWAPRVPVNAAQAKAQGIKIGAGRPLRSL